MARTAISTYRYVDVPLYRQMCRCKDTKSVPLCRHVDITDCRHLGTYRYVDTQRLIRKYCRYSGTIICTDISTYIRTGISKITQWSTKFCRYSGTKNIFSTMTNKSTILNEEQNCAAKLVIVFLYIDRRPLRYTNHVHLTRY